MALTILQSPVSIFAQGSVDRATNNLGKSIKQLSTGLRINSAADDAAGMAVSEKLRSQISGMKAASRNLQDGQSMLQVASEGMVQINGMVSRMRELAVAAGNPVYSGSDSSLLQLEVDNLKTEINRISNSVEFNGRKLLNGDASALWSSSNPAVQAIMTGDTENANYMIDIAEGTVGTNSVYKSIQLSTGINTAGDANLPATDASVLSALLSFQKNGLTGNFDQELTITGGNGKSSTFKISMNQNLENLREKLEGALTSIYGTDDGTARVSISANGSLIIGGGAVGEASNLSFSGSSQLMNALGINQSSVGTDTVFNYTLTKNNGAEVTGSTTGEIFTSSGVNFKLDPLAFQTTIMGTDGVAAVAISAGAAIINIINNAPIAQYGANAGQTMSLAIGQVNTTSLGLDNLNVLSQQGRANAMSLADNALTRLAKQSTQVGGKMNALDNATTLLQVSRENLSAAESRIRDLDMAEATSIFASRQVLLQSANAMLTQANLIPSYALQLLR